jgi:hypothetical protein
MGTTMSVIEINTPVMTLAGFYAAPRQGHLDRVRRIYGYMPKTLHASIRILTDIPDYSDLSDMKIFMKS